METEERETLFQGHSVEKGRYTMYLVWVVDMEETRREGDGGEKRKRWEKERDMPKTS